ncbi:MAG: LacI family DNA-binding transcriptional regulator [Rhizobiales bacterium]|nr:LacI family DNA-binding transcriptional regulator [Hyphomicrobiales bacterium]MBI3672851.1 LacI family DNA-binding transcriptional regulator [Hyphomicrobiales bacterium]
MPRRPTIADLARTAGVSISTVDRVINSRDPVRKPTADKVFRAAQELGFYAAGLIRQRLGEPRPPRRLGFLLLQRDRAFYQILGETLAEASRASGLVQASPRIVHMNDLDPGAVAAEIEGLGADADVLAVVAANHPRIATAIVSLHTRKVPVFALISEITAACPVGFVGLDNFKVGRTAAWTIANICRGPGKVGIIVGSHRFRCQDLNEMGFRSFFREHAPDFDLLEPLASLEDARFAAEVTRDLLTRAPDLAGLYVAGGGGSGVLAAVRETEHTGRLIVVGHDLTRHTQAGLIDGQLKLVISHPVKALAATLVGAMAEATLQPKPAALPAHILPFEIHTAENL